MDYEKKYKEALESARQEYNTTENVERKQWLEELFPELKESEDERIRKEIISALKWANPDGIYDDHIAWLEKQGKQEEPQVYETEDGEIITYSETNGYKAGKPKFKVGDWVVYNRNDSSREILYVYDIRDGRYYFNDNIHFSWSVKECDEKCHLWSIEDTKDGDVLTYNDSENNVWVCIFKEYANERVYDYCTLDKESFWEYDNWNYLASFRYTPATKEQRDLLFQKMKEKGYEWDAEKKELKKIEPIDEYEGLTDFERTVADICIGWIGKEIGWKEYIKDNADVLLKIAVEKLNSVQDAPFEQKPTDEEMKTLLRTEYEKGRADAIAEIQNHNWSEEDERIYKSIIYSFAHNYPLTIQQQEFVKSIRPQNTWKPSDEQMKALYDLNLTGNIFYAGQGQVLIELYNDLKKLAEE